MTTAHRFEYKARNGWQAACDIRLFQHKERTIMIVTDVDCGPSVTNECEHIATLLHRSRVRFDVFIEHYEDLTLNSDHKPLDTYDLVDFTWVDDIASDPEWAPLTIERVETLIGQTLPRRTL